MHKHTILLVSILFLWSGSKVFCQDLIRTENLIAADSGITSGGSSVFSHIRTFGMRPNGDEFDCGLTIFPSFHQLYVISQQVDLIYFESYFDSTYVNIYEQGYYRKTYVDNVTGYCWKKDLIWNTFDQTGKLVATDYYNCGTFIKPLDQ